MSGLYLIVKKEELNDQYECDADRTPILITQDKKIIAQYENNFEYEIYYADGFNILLERF